MVGGFGNINFGKQYRQGNRVYSSDSVAMAICSSPLGNMGGYSYLYSVEDNSAIGKDYKPLRYERTEYAKKIRKQYEAHEIEERRCNMREYGVRDDGVCPTISTVQKDTYMIEINNLGIVDRLYENRSERVYTDYSPTLRSERTGLEVLENVVINDRGFADKKTQVNTDGICPTLRAESHGNLPKVISCAMRGRYDEDGKVEQHLEINTDEYANCITGVSKDSLVLEESNEQKR